MVISIRNAEYVNDFTISLSFSDNIKQVIDFGPFLRKSKNPMTSKYLAQDLFQSFRIENGDLVWGDYELCFPIWDLHQGLI